MHVCVCVCVCVCVRAIHQLEKTMLCYYTQSPSGEWMVQDKYIHASHIEKDCQVIVECHILWFTYYKNFVSTL